MMNETQLEALIKKASSSFCFGDEKRRVKASKDGAEGDIYTQKLESIIQSRLSKKEQLLFCRAQNLRNLGLQAARQGDLERASQLFTSSVNLGDFSHISTISTEAELLNKSLQLPAEAYLAHRRANFAQARDLILKALEIDSLLEDKYGYDILHIHRILLLNNLVRITAKQQYFGKFAQQIGQILGYLKGRLNDLPFSGEWSKDRVKRQPPSLIGAMFASINSELALVIAGESDQVASDVFKEATQYLDLNEASPDEAISWLSVKQAFLENNIPIFLEKASCFLCQNRDDLLWYATAVDLFLVCKDLPLSKSLGLSQEIVRRSVDWNIPQKLVSVLDN